MKVNTTDMRHKVIMAVKDNPQAANDDKLLISLIWKREGWNSNRELLTNLRLVSSAETIRRTRQKLIEEGLIEPSQEAFEYRYGDFKEARRSV